MESTRFPRPDVQYRARKCAPGAGCPGYEPDVRGARCPGPQSDVRAPNSRMNSRNSILGAEIDDFGGKIAEISWMESGGKLDPLVTKQIHGSKSTKHHQTNKSQKKLGAIFGGDFRI